MPRRCSLPAMFCEECVGAGLSDGRGLPVHDGGGDVRVFYAERAAKAAADVGAFEFLEFQSRDVLQEPARLVAHTKFAQARTRVVIGHGSVERRRDLLHPAHVDEERHEFVDLLRKCLGTATPLRPFFEEFRIVQLEHAPARARGGDDVVVALESRDHLFSDRARILAVSGIVGRLAAAGLRRRNLNVTPRRLDQLDGGKADARAKKVHEACDEQGHPRPG